MSEDPYHDAYSDEPFTNITPAIKAIEIDPYSDEYTHIPEGNEDVTYYPTPPAPKTRITPNSPSEDYLKLSKAKSTKLEDPMKARKLLVLDLNGTLLFRTPHARHKLPQKESSTDDVYAQFPSGPRPLRSVNPRPYISSFREYIFHPATRRWLDTMVWSSAQPHSVKDMVEKCFGEDAVEEEDMGGRGRGRGRNRGRGGGGSGAGSSGVEVDEFGREKRGKLVAVWARDTLGLDVEMYNKKTQTTKDLTKLWKEWRHHSAESTLLLDDSPLKARLQPYNHVCVPEYTQELRDWDLGLDPEVTKTAGHEEEDKVQGKDSSTGSRDPSVDPPPGTVDTERNKETSAKVPLKRKRSDTQPFDHILLAVIGVLDAVKHQSNVSSWVRNGGIWADDHKRCDNEDRGGDEDDGLDSLYLATSPDLGDEGVVDPNIRKKVGPKARWRTNKNSKRRRIAGDAGQGGDEVSDEPCRKGKRERAAEGKEKETETETPQEVDGNISDASDTTSKNDGETAGTSNSNSNATLTDADSKDSLTSHTFSSTSSLKKPSTLTYTESIGTFEPITTFIDTRNTRTGSGLSPSMDEASHGSEDNISIPGLTLPLGRSPLDAIPVENEDTRPSPRSSPIMWYQDTETRRYWVQRGRKALHELGIECLSGVVRSSQTN
ncbi:hypothetical protein L218DRAFT_706738 [Marasmius fiardii PR-910]|nr:hypothetical protein L218DRAFT_706738 [Marasmius fiardii PR-910]